MKEDGSRQWRLLETKRLVGWMLGRFEVIVVLRRGIRLADV